MAKHRRRKKSGSHGVSGARLSCKVVAVKRRIVLKCPGARPIMLKRGKGGLVPIMKKGKKGGRGRSSRSPTGASVRDLLAV
jgi:hypothetical protein